MPELKEVLPESEPEPRLPYPTPRQQQMLWSALTSLAVMALFGVAALVFYGFITFLSWAYPVLLPLGLAVIIALVLEPVVKFMQKLGMKRQSSTLAVCLLTVFAFLIFWAYLLPPLCREAGGFFSHLPGWIDEGVDKLQNLENAPLASAPGDSSPTASPAPAEGESFFVSLSNWFSPGEAQPASASPPPAATLTNLSPGSPVVPSPTNQVNPAFVPSAAPAPAPVKASLHLRKISPRRPIVNNSAIDEWIKTNLPVVETTIQNNVAHLVYTVVGPIGQALGFILGFGFVPIYTYYFLADQDHITKHWHDYVPLRNSPLRNEVVSVLAEINDVLVRYFRGQIIVAGCNGVLTFIGLTVVGIPYSLVLGLMAGALSIVPFLGIIVSILPALLLGFLSGHSWIKPVGVLVVFTIVQMSESMFITPRVQSHSTGLHPLTIIIGILFWSMLLPGLLGPVIAVPLTCAIVVLLRRYIWQISAAELSSASGKSTAVEE